MHPTLLALLIVAACPPTVKTTVKVRNVISDGRSYVQETLYHYATDSLGRRGFFDDRGHPYTGDDTFVLRLTDALCRIEDGGPAGHDLIHALEDVPRTVQVAYGHLNEADMDRGEYVHWDPKTTLCAPDQKGKFERPAFIGLAHELAHVADVWNGTLNRKTWRILPGEDGQVMIIPYAELFATHIENKIRAENGLPLRVSYASAILGPEGERRFADAASLLLRPGTRQSLYYDCQGHTTYHVLRRGVCPETY